MKTKRIRIWVAEYLETGPKNTHQILDYLHERSKMGTTSQGLGNVLAKDERFVKVGIERVKREYGPSTDVSIWALAEELIGA